jgi:hypothetical protein
VGQLPVLSPREVIGILRALGFEEVRQRGSHKQFRHDERSRERRREEALRLAPEDRARGVGPRGAAHLRDENWRSSSPFGAIGYARSQRAT